MLQRRSFLSGVGRAGIAAAAVTCTFQAWAQRVTQPIVRPRPGGALVQGRFDGVASGGLPGVYVVVGVDPKAGTMDLRDESGLTGVVHVRDDLFDLESLQIGDEVEVDLLVPQPGVTQLEAGGVWKVQR